MIHQPYQTPGGILYSFEVSVQYKSYLLPLLIFAACLTQCPSSVLLMSQSFLKCRALTSRLTILLFRSCPPHHSRLRAVLYPHHIPHSPVRRSPARVRTCPATRSRRLPFRQPALGPWPLLRPQHRSPSTGIRAGPRTRRAVLLEMHLHSVSASYPTTPPSGMWKRFTSSFVHCQVRGVNTDPCLFRKRTPKA